MERKVPRLKPADEWIDVYLSSMIMSPKFDQILPKNEGLRVLLV